MNRTLLPKAGAFATACLSISLSLITLQTNAGQKSTEVRDPVSVNASSPRLGSGLIIKYKSAAALPKGLSSRFAGQNAASVGFLKASAAANKRGISLLFDKPLATGGYLLKQSAPLTAVQRRELIREIASDPAVEYVEPDGVRRHMFLPNDVDYPVQWHYQNGIAGIDMPSAWDLANGSSVRVAVVDSGSTSHPDLTPNLIGGYDFISNKLRANDGDGRDSNPTDSGDGVSASEAYWLCEQPYVGYGSSWHGTHVAGTVAALTNNGLGGAGVAFGSKVVPIRVLGKCGGDTSDIADAVIWAAGGTVAGAPANPYPAKVINLSLGGFEPCSATEQAAINIARGLGATIVVAAGNGYGNASDYSPGNCSGVITVAATDETGSKVASSNSGPLVGLGAPGDYVYSTSNSGNYAPESPTYEYWTGTSMAVPHVAGVAALVLQLNPAFTPDQVTARLKLGSSVFPGSCSNCGAGLLNAYGALVPPTFDAGTVFRFHDLKTGVHLFTATPGERDIILGALPWFLYERAAFKVQPQSGNASLPVYRFRNQENGAYFFTINEAEKNAVLQMPAFALEGVAWWARSPSSPGAGTIPLHRFRYTPSGSHFYSYSPNEVAHIRANLSHLYAYEGIAFYVWPL